MVQAVVQLEKLWPAVAALLWRGFGAVKMPSSSIFKGDLGDYRGRRRPSTQPSPPNPGTSGSSTGSRPKLARRACDSCKVRKIRCTEVPPCSGCVASGIECTFTRLQATRGPRGLRPKTIDKIEKKRRKESLDSADDSSACKGKEKETSLIDELPHLIEILDVYAERLFPIWPIVDAADLKQRLLETPGQLNAARHLAHAVALAAVAQLRLEMPWQCRLEQTEVSGLGEGLDLLNGLRISFFLHIYHENAAAGGTKSLVYLREAITQAQILGLDRESTYSTLSEADQHVSRRILWLLFVTERGVALLHKLPVVLKPNILFPWFGGAGDQAQVLPAFLKLVHLFWVFDESGIFEILRNADTDVPNMASVAQSCLELLQQKLMDSVGDDDWGPINDVQRADMFVTRQWMRAVLWRAALRFGIVIPSMNPVSIAEDFLSLVSQLPTTALESHGPTLEFKTFEIATAVIDAMASNHPAAATDQPGPILRRLRDILSSSRGGNRTLLSLLNIKMEAASESGLLTDNVDEQQIANDAIVFNLDEANWHSVSVLTGATDMTLPTYQFMEEQASRISWAPLDLGYLVRSPSPLTRMLLESMPRDTTTDKDQAIANTGMVYRRLGRSGLHVSAISLGSWLTYGGYAEDEASFACMKKAYDLGINFFDTAENYTAGKAEIVMGKAIKHFGWKRSDLVISTKINWGAVNGDILINNHGLSRKHIIEGLEASLERLQLKHVDIVYAHRPDRLTPMEETVRAFNYVIDQGMAHYWGTSEWSADEIAEAVGIARDLRMIGPIVEQPQYNMLVRDRVEGQFQRLYERTGLGLTTYSPIKMGLLSGKYNDVVDGEPPKDSRFGASKDRFANYMRGRMGSDDWKQEIETVRQLKPIADRLGVSQSQLAIAWCLKNPNVSSVITGASRPEQLEETVAALKIIEKLTPEVMAEIDAVTKNKVELDPARQD
ncbi:NADP-dependent oxidoreductase domain-containing protein [Mariannaea sp. PMI_226]|nr:NADP-dependent oxidoreductase domain-containing protein [Mariannaea sp. PMI_226]